MTKIKNERGEIINDIIELKKSQTTPQTVMCKQTEQWEEMNQFLETWSSNTESGGNRQSEQTDH